MTDRSRFKRLPEGIQSRVDGGAHLLTAVREWRGYTCSELCDLAEVQLVILMLAERGGDLLPEEAEALAQVLGVDVDLISTPQRPEPTMKTARRPPTGSIKPI